MKVLLLFLLLTTAVSATTLRGNNHLQNLANPFACSMEAADESSCKTSKDDDGSPCVWCTFANAGGVCVSSTQSEEISNVVPQVTCGDNDSPLQEESEEEGSMDSHLLDCLKQAEEEYCTCTWCTLKSSGGFGLCLDEEAAEAL